MTSFTFLWLIWLLFFAVIEGVALVRKARGDTLTEHVWKWMSVKDKPAGWRWRRVALAVFLVWLGLHFTGVL